jgi:hypothetical protein
MLLLNCSMVKLNKDRIFNVVKLLRSGFNSNELIFNYDYDEEEVILARKILESYEQRKLFS